MKLHVRAAFDRNILRPLASDDFWSNPSQPAQQTTARSYDEDQRLHIKNNTISKANVCVYYGREIPGAEQLGLLLDRPYRLLRDPQELARAAHTFNNLPLLSEHVHVTAENPRNDLIIGSSGTDANFDGEHLRVSLVVWVADFIRRIQAGEQKELSSCYRYDADMTPGEYLGERYDGRMINLRGNHIALVVAGRAGPTVVVGDSARGKRVLGVLDYKEPVMAKRTYMTAFGMLAEQRLNGFLAPRLAADQKIDLAPVIKVMGSAKQFPSNIEKVAAALRTAMTGKLAADADVADVQEVLAQIADMAPEVADLVIGGPEAVMAGAAANDPSSVVPGDPTEPTDANAAPKSPDGIDPANATAAKPEALNDAPPADVSKETEDKTNTSDTSADPKDPASPEQNDNPNDPPQSAVKQFLSYVQDNKLTDEEIAAVKAALEGMMANSADTVTKTAMDSAVSAAAEKARRDAVADFKAIRIAEAAVLPLIGPIAPTAAFDSADAVYRHALEKLGVPDAKTVHASALPTLLRMATDAATARPSLPNFKAVISAEDGAGYTTRYGKASERLK